MGKYKSFERYKEAMLGFHGSNDGGCTWIKIEEKDRERYELLTKTTLDKEGELKVRQVKNK